MSSVLAIVSKAIFEKMVDKSTTVGDLVRTDRYGSNPAAFATLGKGDSIFLVTVRPPREALWLVGIIDAPTKRGNTWVGKANTTRIRDITSLISKLKFSNGKGVTAKPGALAMSLQTPRVLTDDDVALLRSRGRRSDDRDAGARGGARFAFANYRRPFAMLEKLAKAQYKQLALLTANNDAGKPEQCVSDDEWAPMELVDVIDVASGRPAYQLYAWPSGSGALFVADKQTLLGSVIQHSFQMDADVDDLELRKALAAAYAVSDPKLATTIDFELARAPQKRTPTEKETRAQQQAAMKKLERVMGVSRERYRLFDKLTKVQQTAIRELLPQLDPYEYFGHFERLGLPPHHSLARWAGVAAPTLLERTVGAWPVWKWLKSAQVGDIDIAACARALAKVLPADTLAEIAWSVCTTERNNGVTAYELWARELASNKAMNDAAAHMIRLLAAIVDAGADDAAVAFAKRAQRHLAKEAEPYLAAVASFALAARARRRSEPFPKRFFSLAAESNSLGNGTQLRAALRELVELMPPKERGEFMELQGYGCAAVHDEEIVGAGRSERRREVPVLIHGWLIADLVPTEKMAKEMVDDVVRWNNDTKPTQEAVDMLVRVGAICVPHIKRGLASIKNRHKPVLEQALRRIAAESGNERMTTKRAR